MRILFCCTLLFLAGCTNDAVIKERHVGIIDACYTKLEKAPESSSAIDAYLQKQEKASWVTSREVFIIKSCIKRTSESEKWK